MRDQFSASNEGDYYDAPADYSGGGSSEKMLHLKDLLPRLLVRWHWIFLGLLLGMAVGFYQVWRAVPQYEAIATVVVNENDASILPEGGSRAPVAVEIVLDGLSSGSVCEAVANDLEVQGLAKIEPPQPKTVPFLGSGKSSEGNADEPLSPGRIARMVSQWTIVKMRPKSRFIDVKVRHPEPEVARTIAAKVVEYYMLQRKNENQTSDSESLEFLIAESERMRGELQVNKSVLSSYTAPLDAEKELAAAESDVQVLQRRYRHKHPKMIEAVARENQAREAMTKHLIKAVRNPVDSDYWSGHRERLGDLERPEVLEQIRDLLIARRAVLESEIKSQNDFYATLLSKIEMGEINTKQTGADVLVQTPASLPNKPVSPQKLRMIVQAAALGLFAGVGLAFLFQLLDNKLHTVAEAESQLGLPILAAISSLDDKNGERYAEKVKQDENGWESERGKWAPQLIFREHNVDVPHAEMFRVLRTSISLLGPAARRKITMVTSAMPGEGKTFVASNLAVAFAQQGRKTLLIDFDLRKPSVWKMFGENDRRDAGVADVLTGNCDFADVIVPASGEKNLSLLLSGPKAPNPGELLEAGRLEEVLDQISAEYSHIVLDTAPLLAVPDSRIIAPFADTLALVTRADQTPRAAIKRAIQTLRTSGVAPDGVVFNGYTEKRVLAGQNYSYGYGSYGYGEEEESES